MEKINTKMVQGCEQLSKYAFEEQIGRGASGICYRVRNIHQRKNYAMKKIIIFSGGTATKSQNAKKMKAAWMEVLILSKLKHPNIIKYIEAFCDNQYLYIIMELANKGDLHTMIKKRKVKGQYYQESQIWQMMKQIIESLQYLHQNNIVHRDVKTMNILIGNDDTLKLGDLGVSKILETQLDYGLYSRVGTPLFLAPEIIKYQKYDYKADIWGTGCIAYCLSTFEHPFQGKNIISLGQNIAHMNPKPINEFREYSDKLGSMIKDMLQKNPLKRLSARQILKKYYIENIQTNTLLKQLKQEEIINKSVKKVQKKSKEVMQIKMEESICVLNKESISIQNEQIKCEQKSQRLPSEEKSIRLQRIVTKNNEQNKIQTIKSVTKSNRVIKPPQRQVIDVGNRYSSNHFQPIVIKNNFFAFMKPQKQFVSMTSNRLISSVALKNLDKKIQPPDSIKQQHTIIFNPSIKPQNNHQLTKVHRHRCSTAKPTRQQHNAIPISQQSNISFEKEKQPILIPIRYQSSINQIYPYPQQQNNKINDLNKRMSQFQSYVSNHQQRVRPQSSIGRKGRYEMMIREMKKKIDRPNQSIDIETKILSTPEVILL